MRGCIDYPEVGIAFAHECREDFSALSKDPPFDTRRSATIGAVLFLLASAWHAAALEPCRIEVRDATCGWPVPLVELRTTSQVRLVSDNAGIIACDLPELMGRETWFEVIGHGYGVKPDGFGARGVRLTPQPGATLKVEVQRTNLARRLGRLTGSGLFAESQKFGPALDWTEQGLTGCDSVQVAVHDGRIFWAWGDSLVARYALGIYHTTSATTPLQPLASFEPPLRLRFDYFADEKGRPRAVAQMPGDGPTWLSGYVSLPDAAGRAHLVATYVKIHGHLDVYEAGLCEWNEEATKFEPVRAVWKAADGTKRPPMPDGHAALGRDATGRAWVWFGDPFPRLRCPETYEAWRDAATWETLTPEASLSDAASGQPVQPHSGSIAWSEYRQKWVAVFVQKFGRPSAFGEVWYAEAAAPTGPWGAAIKVLSHDNYTFYNPCLHPELTSAKSTILLFEGTYTAEFADHPPVTPRYNYNQILYRLDLDEPALAPAQR